MSIENFSENQKKIIDEFCTWIAKAKDRIAKCDCQYENCAICYFLLKNKNGDIVDSVELRILLHSFCDMNFLSTEESEEIFDFAISKQYWINEKQ